MPSLRNNRQNDSTSLLKAIRHLRPRGSYDPLPSPGGYPLPAYIRRKFSFAPQLPNISLLSLMPDFASSSISLDGMQESSSLHVQYIPKRPERVSVEQNLKSPEIRSRSVVTDKASNRSVKVQDPSTRNLRKVHGRTSLRAQMDIDTASEISSVHSKHTTPRTSLDSLDDNGSDSIDTTYQLVRYLAEESPNLFGTFCILDLQLEGNPVRCITDDMLPIDLDSDEYLFLDEKAFGTPYQLQTMLYDGQEMQEVPVAGTLIDVKDATASHRWVGLVDLNNFIRSLYEDIWLTIASEEMDKAGIRRTAVNSKACPAIPASADLGEVIQTLHRDYFIIGVTGRYWGITMVSPTLSASKDVRRSGFLDIYSMTDQLNVPLRFTTRVNWSTPGLHDKLYCIPMSGPKLVCWLCFLVDNELPDLWS